MTKKLLPICVFLSIVSICGAQNLSPQPNKRGLWGYVNDQGKYIIKPVYQSAEKFSSDLACVKINGSYGYINHLGQFVISASFDDAESFDGKYAKCSKNGKYGYIDTSGHCVLDFEYCDISVSDNKQFLIGKKNGDHSRYIVPLNCSSLTASRFDSVSLESCKGYYAVYLDGKVGYIHPSGKIAVAPVFLDKLSFSETDIAISHKETGYGIVNSSLITIVPESYSFIKALNSGCYMFGNDKTRFGLISKSGKIIFNDDKYTQTKIFEQGKYIEARKSDKISVILLDGTVVVSDCDSYSVDNSLLTYCIGKTTCKKNLISGKMAIMVNGKDLWTNDKAVSIKIEDPFVVWTDYSGNGHLMNFDGVAVFEEYTSAKVLSKGLYCVEKDGHEAVADVSGKQLSGWMKSVSSIDGEYIRLIMDTGYGNKLRCAIMRGNNGTMVTGWDFTWISDPLSNGLIPVELIKGDRLSRTSKLLKMMGDNFYVADSPSEGMYAITDFKTGKMGVMTDEGKILVSPKYDEVGEYSCGMCRVWMVDKGNGFINKSGSLVIPCMYKTVLDFGQIYGVEDYTQVWDYEGYTYYIDKRGAMIDPDKMLRESYDRQKGNSWY